MPIQPPQVFEPLFPPPLEEVAVDVHIPNLPNNPEQPAADFHGKFKDTYVLASSDKFEDSVIYIADIHPIVDDPKAKNFHITAYIKSEGIVVEYRNLKILAAMPSSKYVNDGEYALYFARMAERQWKRGLCKNTMGVSITGSGLAQVERAFFMEKKQFNKKFTFKWSSQGNYLNTDMAKRLFKPEYNSYLDTINLLKNYQVISHAFHQSYCLALSAVHDGLDLYRESSILGRVSCDNPMKVVLNSKLFLQEVTDLYRRMGLTAQITVE